MRGVVLLVAAGGGTRLGAGPKAFVPVAGVPMLRRAAEAAAAAELVDAVVAAVPPGAEDRARGVLGELPVPCRIVSGGASRQASVAGALEAAGEAEAVAVHDAARPLCPPALFDRCLEALDRHPAVLAAGAVTDTVKVVSGGLVTATLDRSSLAAAQTPQAFRADVLRQAHAAAARDGIEATDDVALAELLGIEVAVVEGSDRNLKITTPVDLAVAEELLRRQGA